MGLFVIKVDLIRRVARPINEVIERIGRLYIGKTTTHKLLQVVGLTSSLYFQKKI